VEKKGVESEKSTCDVKV